jgi:hypothetical protein
LVTTTRPSASAIDLICGSVVRLPAGNPSREQHHAQG